MEEKEKKKDQSEEIRNSGQSDGLVLQGAENLGQGTEQLEAHTKNVNNREKELQAKPKLGKQTQLKKKRKGESIQLANHDKKINFALALQSKTQQQMYEAKQASGIAIKDVESVTKKNINQAQNQGRQEQKQGKQTQLFQEQNNQINQQTKSNQSSPILRSSNNLNPNDEQFDVSSRKTKETFRSSISSCQDYLENVFNYYCKLSYPLGKNPTFQQINNKVKRMQLTNFMRFCKDFKIREKVQRKEIVKIFQIKSSFQKYLTCQQFRSVILYLSEKIFPNFQQDRRFGKMLLFLQIHNSYSFVRRMNELGVMLRMKNKRGIDVRSSPKYQYKLTPYNGKYQQQIEIQVKQRSLNRKQLKQEQVLWHRKNKLNKIDQLYKNGVKKKVGQDKKTGGSRLQSDISQIANENIDLSHSYLNINKSKLGCYNPSSILAPLKGNSYSIMNQEKRKVLLNQKSERIYGPNLLSHRSKEYKLSQIIQKARNAVQTQKKPEIKQVGIIKKQVLSQPQTQSSSYLVGNQQRDYALQQVAILSQIRSISPSNPSYQTSKQFLRATAKVRKQNKQQMVRLQDLIGIHEKQKDKYLQKHLENQKNYEEGLVKKGFGGGR